MHKKMVVAGNDPAYPNHINEYVPDEIGIVATMAEYF